MASARVLVAVCMRALEEASTMALTRSRSKELAADSNAARYLGQFEQRREADMIPEAYGL